MEPQKVCDLHNGFFYSIPFHLYNTLLILLYRLPPVLFTKNNKKPWNERKESFLYIWLLQRTRKSISKKLKNRIFRNNFIFRHICMYKQPILTQQWNFKTSMQILSSYLRYTDRLLDVFLLLLALPLSEAYEKPKRKG